LERRTEFHAVVHGTLATLRHPRRDQLAFELGDRGHDVEDQAASGARGVDVLLAQADKADVVLAEAFEDVEQVAHRSRQAVEAGDDNDVARLQLFPHPLKGVAGAVRAASLLAINPLAARNRGFFCGRTRTRLQWQHLPFLVVKSLFFLRFNCSQKWLHFGCSWLHLSCSCDSCCSWVAAVGSDICCSWGGGSWFPHNLPFVPVAPVCF